MSNPTEGLRKGLKHLSPRSLIPKVKGEKVVRSLKFAEGCRRWTDTARISPQPTAFCLTF